MGIFDWATLLSIVCIAFWKVRYFIPDCKVNSVSLGFRTRYIIIANRSNNEDATASDKPRTFCEVSDFVWKEKSELLISVNHNFKNIWQCHLCNLNRRFPRSSTVVDTLLRSCQCLHAIFTAKSQLIVSTWEKKNSNIDPRKLMYITRQTSFLSLIYTTTNT